MDEKLSQQKIDCSRTSTMGRMKKKGESGAATNYISRTHAIKKLQLSLADFRRLCIIKGIYPRDPPNRKKISGGSTANRTYYFVKDIKFLAHEPLIEKFREIKVFTRKLKKAIVKDQPGRAKSLRDQEPQLKLDHIVRERYPSFVDALRDLDDCLCLIFLFANFPQHRDVQNTYVAKCRRFAQEFMYYVTLTRSLRKVFLSIKGIYYQVEIKGQIITWIVPYKFTTEVTPDIDLRVMNTFLMFYTTLMGFVNFKLFADFGLEYPPKVDPTKAAEDIGISSLIFSSKDVETAATARKNIGSTTELDQFPEQMEGGDDWIDNLGELKKKKKELQTFTKLFEGCFFFLSREVPKEALEFVIRCFGGEVSWESVGGVGAGPYSADDARITHHIVDRPKIDVLFDSRRYIQPQWVFDCVNAQQLLPTVEYHPGCVLPAHLSPFVEETEDSYIPLERQHQLEQLRQIELNSTNEHQHSGPINDLAPDNIADQTAEEIDNDAVRKADDVDDDELHRRQLEAELRGEDADSLTKAHFEKKKRKEQKNAIKLAQEADREREELTKMVMTQKTRRLYSKIINEKLACTQHYNVLETDMELIVSQNAMTLESPNKRIYQGIGFEPQDDCDILKIHIAKNIKDTVNHTREDFKFKFQKVFDQGITQDHVFSHVAKPVLDSVIQGYNGTIFAYGQTGSGKTFTITGGAESYEQRGLIPRILEHLFQYYQENTNREFSTRVSYLEIYNENGYDLLGIPQKGNIQGMEDLPKINLMEGTDGDVHLNNLSQLPVETTEQALNALFVGDTNRMIAETPMNQASTRSHCIFTIYVTSRETGSSIWRKGKLHLVDLAGSERVKKTNVEGVLLTEAKYINLSLHYLEQVIVALSEKARRHIPYRNSLLTSVLRDSLGGNCKTTMIATMSMEESNIPESISTCRFSQRVALVKNDARLNEELDPKLEIARLKQEVSRLKSELALLSGDIDTSTPLTDSDLEHLKKLVDAYISNASPESELVFGDMRKILFCFAYMKDKVLDAKKSESLQTTDASSMSQAISTQPARYYDNEKTADYVRRLIYSILFTSWLNILKVSHLEALVEQRDKEIRILVAKLRRAREGLGDTVISDTTSKFSHSSSEAPSNTIEMNPEQKKKLLEEYKRVSQTYSTLERTKASLKELYTQAQQRGQEVQEIKDVISEIKRQIARHQQEHLMEHIRAGLEEEDISDHEVFEMQDELTICQTTYIYRQLAILSALLQIHLLILAETDIVTS
eukprot:gene6728-361_t